MPSEEATYREGIDRQFAEANGRMKHFAEDTHETLARMEGTMTVEFNEMKRRQDYTNGKLKKVIIALVAVAAFAVGNGLANGSNLLSLLKLLGI